MEGTEKLPLKRSVFASNHPLGGLDGIALIQLLGQHYGDENISFLVNDMLTNVIPLSRVFLPVNKYGGQARGATKLVNEAYESDKQIVVFPAGLVSRKNGKKIRDLEWKKTFISKALATDRDIVPVRFMGENSRLFYSTALWRKRLGLKVNIEQALLPGELCGARGKTFKIIIGDPIPADKLRATGKSAPELAETIRRIVYSIGG